MGRAILLSRRGSAVYGWIIFMMLLAGCAARKPAVLPTVGADISMLPELERAGAVYRDERGSPADVVALLRDHGVDLFRVRLFVDPRRDFNATWGATQDLPTICALSQRVKQRGGRILLDLHYSDTWADPEHQSKPRAWEALGSRALEVQVTRYTTDVIRNLQAHGAGPDIVQVGNEITAGMLFPDGRVLHPPAAGADEQWARLVRLFNAGARGVRAASLADQPIQVMVHIHGGGRPGLPEYFFDRFVEHRPDFDCIGLSFYPVWGDDIEVLRTNMAHLATRYGKPIYIAETAYPWRPLPEAKELPQPMRWPMSPEGQRQFLKQLLRTVAAVPHEQGAGVIWWYPESIPVAGRFIWRGGAEALFDDRGHPLPALQMDQTTP